MKWEHILMVDMAHIAGLVAAWSAYEPYSLCACYYNNYTHKTLRGPRGGLILSSEEFALEHKLNKAVFPGIQGGPLMHVIACKGSLLSKKHYHLNSRQYGKEYCSIMHRHLAKGLTDRGFDLVSGGTDNHLMLVDLRSKNITGKEFEIALDAANITCNKNAIPNDPQKPGITSGVRIGTPAVNNKRI